MNAALLNRLQNRTILGPCSNTSTSCAACAPQGVSKTDRTGTGTLSVFGHQMRFDLAAGFPLVTTKKVHLKSIIHELIWFLAGDTNTAYLKANGVSHLGRVGRRERRSRARLRQAVALVGDARRAQRSIRSREVVETLKTNPDSRRMIVTAWNPADIPDMALAPCHCLFQFYVADGGSPASSTSARPTCSSACRSTSPATRC